MNGMSAQEIIRLSKRLSATFDELDVLYQGVKHRNYGGGPSERVEEIYSHFGRSGRGQQLGTSAYRIATGDTSTYQSYLDRARYAAGLAEQLSSAISQYLREQPETKLGEYLLGVEGDRGYVLQQWGGELSRAANRLKAGRDLQGSVGYLMREVEKLERLKKGGRKAPEKPSHPVFIVTLLVVGSLGLLGLIQPTYVANVTLTPVNQVLAISQVLVTVVSLGVIYFLLKGK